MLRGGNWNSQRLSLATRLSALTCSRRDESDSPRLPFRQWRRHRPTRFATNAELRGSVPAAPKPWQSAASGAPLNPPRVLARARPLANSEEIYVGAAMVDSTKGTSAVV
jgi:hypothetical protein